MWTGKKVYICQNLQLSVSPVIYNLGLKGSPGVKRSNQRCEKLYLLLSAQDTPGIQH